ncbi:hypothetical protein [Leptospira adleri]|uniref:hypothetical protein n=1 Tax=Leptospira adleri TaxID=2023186 RepID=UPI001082D3FF|nr:hypothetical protein [Leptospira adleri]TGM61593.1 hypothetical protein EHQ97_01130 [Leptospira adleri]
MPAQKLLELLADLTCPIDPFVFAGFGSEYQEEYLSKKDDTFDLEDRHIEQFFRSCDIEETVSHLFSILITKPTDFYENLATRRSDPWDHSVNLMISKASEKKPEIVSSVFLRSAHENPRLQKKMIELLGYLDVKISFPILQELESLWKELDQDEKEIFDFIRSEFSKQRNL